eukprot:37834-Heterocapsa_arctica.AAC.1
MLRAQDFPRQVSCSLASPEFGQSILHACQDTAHSGASQVILFQRLQPGHRALRCQSVPGHRALRCQSGRTVSNICNQDTAHSGASQVKANFESVSVKLRTPASQDKSHALTPTRVWSKHLAPGHRALRCQSGRMVFERLQPGHSALRCQSDYTLQTARRIACSRATKLRAGGVGTQRSDAPSASA